MQDRTRGLIVGIGLALAASLFFEARRREEVAHEQQRVVELAQVAKAWRARAHIAMQEFAVMADEADNLRKSAARRDTVVRDRVHLVRDTTVVPDTCRAIVAVRDSLVDEALGLADQWRQVDSVQKAATDSLAESRRLLALADSIQQAATVRALPIILPRKSVLWSLTHPEIQPALFGGACWDATKASPYPSRPCVGVGIAIVPGSRRR
jgi:type II secretory pathway pseudopilin PulG